MRNFLFILLFFVLSTQISFAGGVAIEGPIPSTAIYSADGTHWYNMVSVNGNSSLTVDGVFKASYAYMDSPIYFQNELYTLASDEKGENKFILKNGTLIDQGQNLGFLQSYIDYSHPENTKIYGWYKSSNGIFSIKDTKGNIVMEDRNSGSSSYASPLMNGSIESIVYDRNNQNPRLYINEKKITDGLSAAIGIRKNKKTTDVYYTATNKDSVTELFVYNVDTNKTRKLSSYSGVQTYSNTLDKDGNINELYYIVLIGKKYAILDINGKNLNNETYDELPSIYTYGNKFLIRYLKAGKKYFSFSGTKFGPYEEIDDTFNISYGFHPVTWDKVTAWSVFVQKNGKNYIVVNGKELAY